MAITNAQQAKQIMNEGRPMKKIKGQDHMLAYITPNEANKLVKLGGQETMTPEGILAYPEFDNYTEVGGGSRSDFEGGAYGGTGNAGDGVINQYDGGPPSITNPPPVITPPPKPPKTKDNTLPTLSFLEQFKVNNLKKQFELEKLANKNKFGPIVGLVAQNLKAPELSFYESTSKDDIMDTDYGMSGDDLTRADRLADAINKAEKTGDITQSEFESAFYGPDGPPKSPQGGDGIQDPCKGPNPPAYCFVGIRSAEAATPVKEEDDEIINYRLMAGGGMADETVGGIMDLESSRQMYGLGKLVKKVTRSVKKIAKSPIGKAALLYAGGTYLGGLNAFGGSGTFMSNLKSGQGIGNLFNFGKNKLFGELITGGNAAKGAGYMKKGLLSNKALMGIGIPTALSYFMTPEEEEEQKLLAKGADIDDVDTIINNPYEYTNPRLMAEGGSTEEKEPVAKKVMPLLDMDGKEKDYRETGGFVDMGRMEKADDVPARLSKNEFVFTADAVRNAGDGSVDKGAEVMYNMMKNLESGGDVSEESQGLDGARKMFQTSQRLEEVL